MTDDIGQTFGLHNSNKDESTKNGSCDRWDPFKVHRILRKTMSATSEITSYH